MAKKQRRFLGFLWPIREKPQKGKRSSIRQNNDEAQGIDIDIDASVSAPQVVVRPEWEDKRADLMTIKIIESSMREKHDAITKAYNDPKRLGHAFLEDGKARPIVIALFIPSYLSTQSDVKNLFACVYEALGLAIQHQCRSINFQALGLYYQTHYSDTVLRIVDDASNQFFQNNSQNSLLVYIVDDNFVHRQTTRIGRVISGTNIQHTPTLSTFNLPSFLEEGISDLKRTERSDVTTTPKHEQIAEPSTAAISSTAEQKDDNVGNQTIDKNQAESTKQDVLWIQGEKTDYKIIDGKFVLGEKAGTFSQTPFIAKQFGKKQHDISADIAQVGDILVLAASFRGAMHYASSTVRQDSFAIGAEENDAGTKWAIAVVADGVSEASRAHLLAEFLTQQTVVFVKETLNEKEVKTLADADWTEVAKNLVQASQDCCKRLSQGKISSPKQYLSKWASTLEFAVVEVSVSGKKTYVSVTVSGDGASYIINGEKGWKPIKAGKMRTGSIASNAVTALPIDPGAPIIEFGILNKDEQLFIATDGLSDMIGNGNTALGGFFQKEFPKCKNAISYLQIMDVSMYQADDDRTGILIKENQI
jgi:serine/threonine protein phosphatase PrpC/O-acetyl-ADP-ribose deacetylase (regulator of RNase III)